VNLFVVNEPVHADRRGRLTRSYGLRARPKSGGANLTLEPVAVWNYRRWSSRDQWFRISKGRN